MIDDQPHPLDDDVTMESVEARESAAAHGPLLRASVAVLIVSFLVAFVAGVSASNAPPNSGAEAIGSAINRTYMIVMLGAFCCLLLAYRLPHLQNAFQVSRPSSPRSDLARLIAVNVVVLLCVWSSLTVGVPLLGASVLWLVPPLTVLCLAWLVVVAVWHRGYLRAYALGVLTASFFLFQWGSSALWAVGWGRTVGSPNMVIVWLLGGVVTYLSVTGLVCAGYVWLVERNRPERGSQDSDP